MRVWAQTNAAAADKSAGRPADDGFMPALRFKRLTPLFDVVAAVGVRDQSLKRRVLERAELADGATLLDLGCGTGTLAGSAAREAPGVNVTGLDADASILARARRKAAAAALDIQFDEGRSTVLPYADASFDVVLSTLFFHHLPDFSMASRRPLSTSAANCSRSSPQLECAK